MIVAEWYYQKSRYGKEVPLCIANPEFQDVIISEDEFEERVKQGEKLVILDDLVLTIDEYGWRHPGGSFVIDYCVGRDISKFFHGGYALSGNTTNPNDTVSRIQHTNFSRWIASELAVGRLVK